MRRTSSLRSADNVIVGPILWAIHFLTVYASESLLCRAGLPGWHDALVAGIALIVLLALAGHSAALKRRRTNGQVRRDLAGIAISLDIVSALAVCFVALAAALPACLSN
jgi:hypothetical protein